MSFSHLFLVVLLSIGLVVNSNALKYQSCAKNNDTLTINSIKLNDCEEQPCVIKKESTANVEIKLTASIYLHQTNSKTRL